MTALGRCRDCRWWSESEQLFRAKDVRYCTRVVAYPDPAAYEADEYPNPPETGLFVVHCGCCSAFLVTPPDFGCVQFEAKP